MGLGILEIFEVVNISVIVVVGGGVEVVGIGIGVFFGDCDIEGLSCIFFWDIMCLY